MHLSGLAAGAIGGAVGVAISMAVPVHHKLDSFALALPAAAGAIVAFGVVAFSSTTAICRPSWPGPGEPHPGRGLKAAHPHRSSVRPRLPRAAVVPL